MVLDVRQNVSWTSYIIVLTVNSRPQMQAVLSRMEAMAKDVFERNPTSTNKGRSEWELVDFGDVVVNCMTPRQREYYDLETFYGAAEEIEIEDFIGKRY